MDLFKIQNQRQNWKKEIFEEFLLLVKYIKRLLIKVNADIDFDMQIQHTLVRYQDIILDGQNDFCANCLVSYKYGQLSQSDNVSFTENSFKDDVHIVLNSECPRQDKLGFSYKSNIFIRFNKDIYTEYAKVDNCVDVFKDNINIIKLRDASYIEAILNEVLTEYTEGGNGKTIEYSAQDSILQTAGDVFVGQIATYYSSVLTTENGLGIRYNMLLLSQLNSISSMKYEKAESKGQMLLCAENSITIDYLDILFENPPSLNEHKKIRKLLEITNKNTLLVVVGTIAYGFTTKDRITSLLLEKKKCLIVEIKGTLNWLISLYDFSQENISCRPLIEKILSEYKYPARIVSKDYFIKVAGTVFTENADNEKLWKIVESSANQKHGTMIVFSNIATIEAEKYRDCSFKIKTPTYLSVDMINNITSIDGAVLCDQKGICYSLGVILDGRHENDSGEDISNGARHNSAIRYYNANKGNCVIAIISEDGGVKLLPII